MSNRNSARNAEKKARIYEQRVQGLSVPEIAQAWNLSVGTVYRYLAEKSASRVQETSTELADLELSRLDRYLTHLELQIEAGKAVARNIEIALRVSERRAKLLGMDAPERIEATVHEITQEDLAIAELVRDAQAAAALEEQRIRDGST